MLGYVLFLLCAAYVIVWIAYYVTAFIDVAPRAAEDSVTNTLLIFSALKPVVAALVMFCMIFSIYDPGTLFLLVLSFGVVWTGTVAMGAKLLVDYITCNTPSNPTNLCNDLLFCCAYYASVPSCSGEGPCPGVTPDTLQPDGDFKLLGIFTLVFVFMEILIVVTAFGVLMKMKKNFKDAVVTAEVMERWFDGNLTDSYERLLEDVSHRQDEREAIASARSQLAPSAPPRPVPRVESSISAAPKESDLENAEKSKPASSIMKAKAIGDSITINMNPAIRESNQKGPSPANDTKTSGVRFQKSAKPIATAKGSAGREAKAPWEGTIVPAMAKIGVLRRPESFKKLKSSASSLHLREKAEGAERTSGASFLRTRNATLSGENKPTKGGPGNGDRRAKGSADEGKPPPPPKPTVPSLIKAVVSNGTTAMKNWLKMANLYAWYHVDKYAIEEMFMTNSPNRVRVKRPRRKKKKN
jgi:hypothetical protein